MNSIEIEIFSQIEKVRAMQRREGKNTGQELKKEEIKLDNMLSEYQKIKSTIQR